MKRDSEGQANDEMVDKHYELVVVRVGYEAWRNRVNVVGRAAHGLPVGGIARQVQGRVGQSSTVERCVVAFPDICRAVFLVVFGPLFSPTSLEMSSPPARRFICKSLKSA
jgi:hypothetical protein